ncbi:MAG: hypothetical protein HOP09_11405 [Hyphomicrobium sp.]|nr:hypothetical protein [Hyphomicrobium sp.]
MAIPQFAFARVAVPAGRSAAIIRDGALACRTHSQLHDILLFFKQGDKEAAQKAIKHFGSTGQCSFLKKGDIVVVVSSEENNELVAVRRKGDIQTVHVMLQLLMTDDEVIGWAKARNGDRQVGRLDRMCAAMPKADFCAAFYFNP